MRCSVALLDARRCYNLPVIDPDLYSGIYACFCTVTGKCYVGSAVNILARIKRHRYDLTMNDHINPYFQNAWNKHGSDKFEWTVLEVCGEDQLLDREQHWINHYRKDDPKRIYNIANPVRQRVPSERMSDVHKAYWQSLTEDEYRQRIAHFDDPDFQRRLSELRNAPESVQAVSEKAKARWADPAFRSATIAKMDAFWTDEEKRASAIRARSEAATKLWTDRNHREAMSNIRAERWKDPVYAQERSAGTTALWTDPNYRNKVTATIKNSCNDPAYLAALSDRVTQQHARKRAARRVRLNNLASRLSAVSPH